MSVETLKLLRGLLERVSLSATDPNLEAVAAQVAAAFREIDAALTRAAQ